MTTQKESKIDEGLDEESLLLSIANNNNENRESNSIVGDAIITSTDTRNNEQNAGQERNEHKIQKSGQSTSSKQTKPQDNSTTESTEKAAYFNPYAKLPPQLQPECATLAGKAKKAQEEEHSICDGKDSN